MNYLRIALNNSQFPFKYEERQVPALVPGMDTANRAPAAFTGSAGNMDWNIPQVIHMENYLPTARGYVGVGWLIQNRLGPYGDTLKNTTVDFSGGSLGTWATGHLTIASDIRNATGEHGRYATATVATGTEIFPSKGSEIRFYAAGTVISYAFLYSGTGTILPAISYNTDSNPFTPPASGIQLPGSYNNNTNTFIGSYTIPTSGYYLHYIYLGPEATIRLSSIYIVASDSLATPAHSVDDSNSWGSPLLYKGSKLYSANLGTIFSTEVADLGVSGCLVTTATVNAVTYNHYHHWPSGFNTLRVDGVAQTVIPPTGVPMVFPSGIASSNNYLIIADRSRVFWSTPTNALDFNSYGSGYAQPAGLLGGITAITSISSGFIVFSAQNAVLATYTNIPNAPFRFSVIVGCGGVRTGEQVSGDSQGQAAFAYTTRGFQIISTTGQCNTVAEISDFLAAGQYYSLTDANDLMPVRCLPDNSRRADWFVSVSYLQSRYVTVSYRSAKTPWYQHALVLDLALNRWGHVRVAHTAAIEATFGYNSGGYTSGVYPGLAFLSPTGSTLMAADLSKSDRPVNGEFGTNSHSTFGVKSGIAIGPISLVRGSKITLQEVELSNVGYTLGLKVRAQQSPAGLAGITATTSQEFYGYDAVTDGATKTYCGRLTGDNVELFIAGTINLQNLIIGVTKHGN
jgi:hypothetical protein